LAYTEGVVDNRIKERLTGALILVALVVILVPELLTGRSPRGSNSEVPAARPASEGPPLRSYSMDLTAKPDAPTGQAALNVRPEQDAAPLPAPAVTVPEPPAAAPAPVPSPAPTPVATPAAASSAPTSAPPPAAASKATAAAPEKPVPHAEAPKRKAPPPPAAASKGWSVQVGSFAKRENADRYVQQLARKGYTAHVLGGSTLYRVRVGPAADKAAAVALQAKLAADGYRGSVAAP
jgi:DedD protein